MADYARKVVYLSEEQRAELFANGSITVDGVTIDFNENDIYITPFDADDYMDAIRQSEANAADSAATAETAAQTAASSATEASTSSGAAAASAEDAEVAQGLAEAAAQTATAKADEAAGSATNAAQSADEAAELKSAIENMGASATTLAEGTDATVTKQTDPQTGAVTLAFGIPRGDSGDDGISPTITVTDITGGHRVTVTDATGPHSFDVMDGEDGQGAVQDVQVNGVSVLSDGVANVPLATKDEPGAVKVGNYGVYMYNGAVRLEQPTLNQQRQGTDTTKAVNLSIQHSAAFYGLAKAAGADMYSVADAQVGIYPEAQKSAISEMLSGSVSVSGTTPTINALPGVRYVCGEVSTIDIVTPESGIVDVVFTSGSTPTVLTVTPPTGGTVKWANGFDPTALEAYTTYEINIMDGLGVVGQWS